MITESTLAAHQELHQNEVLEFQLLLQAMLLKYGYDFREYAPASLRRRILQYMEIQAIPTMAELQHRLLYNPQQFQEIFHHITIHVSELFRDPPFFLAWRLVVAPLLAQREFIKIWHAGCASGEEVYSLAILLQEEGLYERCQIYATDFNDQVLEQARQGIYSVATVRQGLENYRHSGGKGSLNDYFSSAYERVRIDPKLRRQILFSSHNLCTDYSFGEMDAIFCRNVLIYFSRDLQNRVLNLFADSLTQGGILALGQKETIRFADVSALFTDLCPNEKIYQKHTNQAENPPGGGAR